MIALIVVGGLLLSRLFVMVAKVGVACTKMHNTSLEQWELDSIIIFCDKNFFPEVTL